MDSLSKPTRIGAYDVVGVIGHGGMGTVFKATDPRIGRSVAIKVLNGAADDPDLLTRFYREAKYTGNLQHQNIVTVYELGHQDGIPYLVMEYLEGVSLETLIASGRSMPMAEKLRIILQVCSGLAYAHKRDLVHRDIKPANIVLVENGTAKIVDFGIARSTENRLTKTGHIIGSLNYMSPEQLNGNVELDLRTDLYSTGVVLFQLLTGVLPFEGGTTAETLRKIVQDPPPALATYMKDCPPELEVIAQKSLAKNREERYSSAEEFAVEIARVQQRYERQMLADYLQQAADSLQRKDFAAAREQVLQVLRVAPQSIEGSDLLRMIKVGQEQQQREQQVLQCQMRAEEAFRKNEFSSALQFIEQGLALDSSRTVFLTLRDAIFEAQSKMGEYREAVQRADAALRAGDLEGAKLAIEDAIETLPDEPECKRLAAQIAARIDERMREQKAAQQQKQFAVVIPAPFNAPVMNGAETAPEVRFEATAEPTNAAPATESDLPADPTAAYQVRLPASFEERSEIAPELLEFLEPDQPKWPSRTMLWFGIALTILAIVSLWLITHAKPKNEASLKPASVGTLLKYSYAEINAEPWGTVIALTPVNGLAQSAVGSVTPLRVKLPAGQYKITLEGPNHEQRQVELTVPPQGGTKCFVVFRKPDVNRLLSRQ